MLVTSEGPSNVHTIIPNMQIDVATYKDPSSIKTTVVVTYEGPSDLQPNFGSASYYLHISLQPSMALLTTIIHSLTLATQCGSDNFHVQKTTLLLH